MIHPTPAIVPQSAVRALPRWALLLLCFAYVVPGFIGRDPWKNADVTAFGYMRELALGNTPWTAPLMAGLPPDTEGLLPYWLGAWSIQWTSSWLSPEMGARLPFVALLAITLAATWYSVYYLARSPGAQPVAFAFGGEASPADYARAMADAGLLALIACLGLAQISHEITSYVTQLTCTALVFYAAAALPLRTIAPLIAAAAGLCGLVLSGAPALAAMWGAGGAALVWATASDTSRRRWPWAAALLVLTLASAVLAWKLDLWRWRIVSADGAKEWDSLARLLLWFSWPAWPLAIWTLWRWRHQIVSREPHRHLLLPIWFLVLTVGATLTTRPSDRALLLGLPALAALAAFALPTLRRSISALIDWFTLLFFSVSAITIWVVWLSVQTGVPAKPARNIARLAPEFVASFSFVAFGTALAATVAWCALVWWRASRNRAAIWKSLVLPASGATLGWLLLMTLWLPLLDHGRSYRLQMQSVRAVMGDAPGCVATYGLSRAQLAGLIYHSDVTLATGQQSVGCDWLVADAGASPPFANVLPARDWKPITTIVRPTDKNDRLVVLRRTAPRR
ncbi:MULTISPECIES: hypothetical protein [unclassified Acidovorax]|uniref:hypothetical protein n=1 Tax=unclassified Acidovorax TaxID=2684926 RepID=UPI0028832082|nr:MULTISPECIES: hypothetical protein [unclassified Acidovorax]